MTKRKEVLTVVKSMEEEEEDAFYCLVDEGGFTLPYQFRNWKAHFLTRTSFLKEAARWLKGEYDDTPKRVITDLECGRGNFFTESVKERARNGYVSPEDRALYEGEVKDEADWRGYGMGEDDYEWMNPPERNSPVRKQWQPGQGYLASHGAYYQASLYSKKLPLEPEIEAPSGLSGKNLVVL